MLKPKTLIAIGAILILTSCGGGSSEEPKSLTGAGATFPAPIYSKWFNEYRKANPTTEINYQPLGSGAGITQITSATVDFGASDQPMTDEKIAEFKKARNTDILHFPTVLGAVVPTYNLPGVTTEINFTGDALAGIFLGTIKKWNDPVIAKANPDLKLPADDIVVVHRSDGSGTSFVWTDYLTKVSKAWAAGPGAGASISWPTGLGGSKNEGVTGLVKQSPNSIGYTEMIYALQNNLPVGKVQNAAGKFVKATPESVTAAAAGVTVPDDFRLSITDAAGAEAYPISSFTWLLIPKKIEDAGKRAVIVVLLKWMLGPGQGMAPGLQYAPLPAAVIAKEQAAIAQVQ
jgi:phosphate transport system substrate-binding protein